LKPFAIKLSQAQYELFREALKESANVGDCELAYVGVRAPTVRFSDHEGVRGTMRRLIAVRTVTTATLRSWEAVKRKIDEGVLAALPPKS